MHPRCGAVHVPFVPVRVTRGALVAHQYSYEPLRCRTSQYHRTLLTNSASVWNDLVDGVFDGVGLAGLKSRDNASLLTRAALSLFVLPLFSLCPCLLLVGNVGLGSLG